jgi:hypothetical protein
VFQRPQRPAWRGQAEQVCLAQKLVRASPYTQPANAIEGPGICGLDHPFKVTALAQGTVALNTTQTVGCPQIAALDQWVTEVVQPIAMARFGQPVAQIDSMGSYNCRPIDNKAGAHLSEHSFGNATDIGGFRLADGREIKVVKAWTRGTDQEQAFLREVQAGACNIFTTVLAPGSDSYHYNHIHLDLAMHGRTSTGPRRICKPLPKPQLLPAPRPGDGLPDAPEIDDDIDIAQAGQSMSASRTAYAMGRLDVGAPTQLAAPTVTSRPVAPAPMPMQHPMPAPVYAGTSTYGRAPVSRPPADLMPPAPVGRPMALVPPAPLRSGAMPSAPVPQPRRGTIRPDGVFEADLDTTSSIRRR